MNIVDRYMNKPFNSDRDLKQENVYNDEKNKSNNIKVKLIIKMLITLISFI